MLFRKPSAPCFKLVSRFLSTGVSQTKLNINDVPDLKTFMKNNPPNAEIGAQQSESKEIYSPPPYITDPTPGNGRNVLVETYGCQMNFSDSEIINSILKTAGYKHTENEQEADIVLLNTCAIRENAEAKIWNRLTELRAHKKKDKRNVTVGVLGCMAERLKSKLLEADKLCDLVVGPDAYRDLPNLLTKLDEGEQEKAINVILSMDETYADITPVRPSDNKISAYVSIMRGCNNMCSYCIVPFTRGRERSRGKETILDEVRKLSSEGFKEVILLGQNVNSYNDVDSASIFHDTTTPSSITAPGFTNLYKRTEFGVRFAELLHFVSQIDPNMRIRFTSPHPKDFPDEVFQLIAERDNICNSIHIPAQSGSNKVLESMRRGHTRESYIELIQRARSIIPNLAISSDFISGFCGETEEDHQDTLNLLREVKYDMAFMFAYSLREKTHAHRALVDDVPQEVKQRRLKEVIDLFYETAIEKSKEEINKKHLVLVEKTSKKSEEHLIGRTDTNKKVVFPKVAIPQSNSPTSKSIPAPGDYVAVNITGPGLTLHGEALEFSSIPHFVKAYGKQ